MRVLIALAALCVALPSIAAEKTFSWTPPAQYTDGSSLDPLTELERYELGCGPTSDDRESVVRTWIATPSSTRVETFDIGDWHCALRVKALTSPTQIGEWSDWSNAVSFTVEPPIRRPVAPADLAVSSGG